MSDSGSASGRVRRPPPSFRRLQVVRTTVVSPRLVRVALGGPELDGFAIDLPAASVRLLVPSPDTDQLVIPEWTGNEFLLPDGSRPIIRTLTPLDHRAGSDPGSEPGLELDVEIVVHGGRLGAWAAAARPGWPAALSGPGRGYALDPAATELVMAGDESALPAIGQLLAALDPDVGVVAHVEIDDPVAALDWGPRVVWSVRDPDQPPGSTLLAAVEAARLGHGTRVWAAGEAAGMQRIRRHLFEERGVARSHATVRGYWKAGRGGDQVDDLG